MTLYFLQCKLTLGTACRVLESVLATCPMTVIITRTVQLLGTVTMADVFNLLTIDCVTGHLKIYWHFHLLFLGCIA